MAFASTRSSADSRFILGGLLLTLALAVLGSESACAAAQPSVSADYAVPLQYFFVKEADS